MARKTLKCGGNKTFKLHFEQYLQHFLNVILLYMQVTTKVTVLSPLIYNTGFKITAQILLEGVT